MNSQRVISPARRRSPACGAISASSSTICCGPRGNSAPTRSPPGTTSSAGTRAEGRRSTARPTAVGTRAISCLRRRATSSPSSAFRLGGLPKKETRAIARRLGLPVADKRDSQDICFVPSGNYARVVERLRPAAQRPGEIVDVEGRVLGTHPGIARFTVGQRRGLGVSSDRPLYVVRLEPEASRVVVGPFEALLRDRVRVHEVNWLGDEPLPAEGLRVEVKLRSTMPAMPARASIDRAGQAVVMLDEPQAGVAPGQACVFYRGDGYSAAAGSNATIRRVPDSYSGGPFTSRRHPRRLLANARSCHSPHRAGPLPVRSPRR